VGVGPRRRGYLTYGRRCHVRPCHPRRVPGDTPRALCLYACNTSSIKSRLHGFSPNGCDRPVAPPYWRARHHIWNHELEPAGGSLSSGAHLRKTWRRRLCLDSSPYRAGAADRLAPSPCHPSVLRAPVLRTEHASHDGLGAVPPLRAQTSANLVGSAPKGLSAAVSRHQEGLSRSSWQSRLARFRNVPWGRDWTVFQHGIPNFPSVADKSRFQLSVMPPVEGRRGCVSTPTSSGGIALVVGPFGLGSPQPNPQPLSLICADATPSTVLVIQGGQRVQKDGMYSILAYECLYVLADRPTHPPSPAWRHYHEDFEIVTDVDVRFTTQDSVRLGIPGTRQPGRSWRARSWSGPPSPPRPSRLRGLP